MWGFISKEKQMALSVLIGNNKKDLDNISKIKSYLDNNPDIPESEEIRSWITNIHDLLTHYPKYTLSYTQDSHK